MMAPSAQDVFQDALRLHQAGDIERAVGVYRSILADTPDHPGANHLLGVALNQQGDSHTALAHIARALSLCDTKALYWNNYGVVLRDLGRLMDAKRAFERALSIRADYPDALSNLGLVLSESFSLDDAERCLRRAVSLAPEHADALKHLGGVRLQQGAASEAVRHFEDSLAVRPGHVETMHKLGEAFLAARDWDLAADAFERVLKIEPDRAETRMVLCSLHSNVGLIEQAAEEAQRVAELRPDRPMWKHRHLGLCPIVFQRSEDIEAHWNALADGLRDATETPPHTETKHLLIDGFAPPFHLAHHMRCRRAVMEQYAALFRPSIPIEFPQRAESERVRVGFLVTERHENGFLRGVSGMIRRLDRSRFEPILLASASVVRKCYDAIRRSDMAALGFPPRLDLAIDEIRETQCDVIYHWQVGTDQANYFLPFTRLAPVQCTGFGTHGTTGVDTMDWFLSSRLLERGPDAAKDYTESLMTFDTIPTWQPRPKTPRQAARTDFELPPSGTLYFCPQRAHKLHPDFDCILREMLQRDGKGHLLLLKGRHPATTDQLKMRLGRTLGENLLKRVHLLPVLSGADYYSLLSVVDVILDSPAYSSSLTGYDAFALGKPIVTLPGENMVQRYALGLYKKMGLDASPSIVSEADSYADTAVRIGTDEDLRESLRRQILERNDVLFEDASAVREFEQFLLEAVSAN